MRKANVLSEVVSGTGDVNTVVSSADLLKQ